MRRPLLLLLLAAGCTSGVVSVLPGPVAQLSTFKSDEAAANTARIAATTIDGDCDGRSGQSAACPQIQAIHARACLVEARKATSPDAACPPPGEAAHLRCAASGFAAAEGAGFMPADRGVFAEQHGRALYCLANLSDDAEGVPLARDAMRALAAVPPDPKRDLLAASSALHIGLARGLDATTRCTNLAEAARIAQRGLGAAPPEALAGALRGVRFDASATSKTLPGCGVS